VDDFAVMGLLLLGTFGVVGFVMLLCKLAGAKVMLPYTKEWWIEWKKKKR